MDALFLTFADPVLEKGYAKHHAVQILKADWRVFGGWFIVRTIMMFHALFGSKDFEWSVQRACACGIFWLLPLIEGVFRRKVQEAWFVLHGTTVHMLQGLLQSVVAMWVAASMLVTSARSDHMVSELILASGAVIQIFNLWWYSMSFKFHLLLSAWTVAVWVAFVMPICTGLMDAMGYTPAVESLVASLNMMFDGLLFCTDGVCLKATNGAGQKLFIFWHVYMYLVVIPCWVWFHERASRVEFLERVDARALQVSIPPVERNMSFLELVSPILLGLPMAWWIISGVCNAVWPMNAS